MSEINFDAYEAVIGLEVHAQLLTKSKAFCGDSAAYGGAPNTHISPITLAHPGTLPRLNTKAIEYAIKMGLVCHCEIEKNNYFARKNYFYPDLPKGYQITQHTTPICKNGYVTIKVDGKERDIALTRIHLEEDAGKSIHDIDPFNTLVDYNRAGVTLIEIVTDPVIHSGDEAYAYLTEIRQMVRYLDICDGNMEEGSMRCDANISIRKKGDTKLGTRVEVKNMNSIRNVKRAIEIEIARLITIVETGGTIVQETRSFDALNGSTFSLRSKEMANDYRYFPEPDLTPFRFTDAFINEIKELLPSLPKELVAKYITELGLPEYDAQVLSDDKATSTFYNQLVEETSNYKAAANWMLGPVKSYLNEKALEIRDFPLSHKSLAALIQLVDEGKVNFSTAASRIFPEMINNPNQTPLEIATGLNLIQDTNADNISPIIDEVLAQYPEKVAEYKAGKKGLMGLFVGEVMKASKGKADPKLTNQLLMEKLNN